MSLEEGVILAVENSLQNACEEDSSKKKKRGQ